MALYTDETELQEDLLQTNYKRARNSLSTTVSASSLQYVPQSRPSHSFYSNAGLGVSPTTIRVLDVAEQHDGGPTLIRCNMRVVDLADKPIFSALSYVWGDPADRETIWAGNNSLQVTRNAWEALRRLRNKFSPLTIWIDAICINQADAVEKGRQISLMGQIYGSASYVYVWLGEGNAKTDRAMRHLAAGALPFRNAAMTVGDLEGASGIDLNDAASIPTGALMRWKLTFHMFFRTYFSLRKTFFYHEVQELLSNAWIQRVWTLQEVLLAARPLLVCGDSCVSWIAFLFAMQAFEFHRKSLDDRRAIGLFLPPAIAPWSEVAGLWTLLHEHDSETAASLPAFDSQKEIAALLKVHGDYLGAVYRSRTTTFLVWLVPLLLMISFFVGSLVFVYAVITGSVNLAPLGVGLIPLFLLGILALLLSFSFCLFWFHPSWVLSRDQGSLPERLNLLAQIAKRRCALEADYYYGVLGIIGSFTSASNDQAQPSLLDHNDAYRSLCLELVPWSQSLDFLLYVSSERSQDTPSWVVQWHQADTRWPTYTYRMGNKSEGPFCAAGDSEPWYEWSSQHGHKLKVRALFFAKIRTKFRPRASQRRRNGWFAGTSRYTDAAKDHRAVVSCSRTSKPNNGVAPRHVQLDDQVALISGLSMPMILRKAVDEGYRVIGPLWLPDPIMHGSEWRGHNPTRLKVITLV